jgi:Mg/Co/Ni transporter MgtE
VVGGAAAEDGGQAGRYTARAMMTSRLARKNVRTGLIVGAICMFMFGLTFVVAAAYVS